MREIPVQKVTAAVKAALLEMNYDTGPDVAAAVRRAWEGETSPLSRGVLEDILANHRIAAERRMAICQDTGMVILFAELGQELHFTGGGFEDAVNRGVREAYAQGCLRKSVVSDPLFDRRNTGDNTPAVIHLRLVPGETLRLHLTAKGFGSENMSRVRMMVPADGEEGVLNFLEETVRLAGPNPCPPVVLGVCVGGTLDKAAQLAKWATLREIGTPNPDPRYRRLEERALERINALGIGAGGLGGTATALAVHIEHYPTHIAGMPVAVNVCCHVARHRTVEL